MQTQDEKMKLLQSEIEHAKQSGRPATFIVNVIPPGIVTVSKTVPCYENGRRLTGLTGKKGK